MADGVIIPRAAPTFTLIARPLVFKVSSLDAPWRVDILHEMKNGRGVYIQYRPTLAGAMNLARSIAMRSAWAPGAQQIHQRIPPKGPTR